jgi:hypothetical protein
MSSKSFVNLLHASASDLTALVEGEDYAFSKEVGAKSNLSSWMQELV